MNKTALSLGCFFVYSPQFLAFPALTRRLSFFASPRPSPEKEKEPASGSSKNEGSLYIKPAKRQAPSPVRLYSAMVSPAVEIKNISLFFHITIANHLSNFITGILTCQCLFRNFFWGSGKGRSHPAFSPGSLFFSRAIHTRQQSREPLPQRAPKGAAKR